MTGGDHALPPVEVNAAAAVARLGRALLANSIDTRLSAEVAAAVDALADRVEVEGTGRTKAEAVRRYAGQQRIEHFVATGSWPPPPPDGDEVNFDVFSFVGGRLSPISAGAVYRRDGDDAVATVRLGPAYEGPPGRVHGGMLASVFDEVMGAVFRILGIASAFTGTLSVRYQAPAPIGAELVFRARLTATEGRKHTVQAEAAGPDGTTVARAEAVFVEMSPGQLALAIESETSDVGAGARALADSGP
ncbi:MAG: PaaI family thioesterase [Acidimicrobiales bacterium]